MSTWLREKLKGNRDDTTIVGDCNDFNTKGNFQSNESGDGNGGLKKRHEGLVERLVAVVHKGIKCELQANLREKNIS